MLSLSDGDVFTCGKVCWRCAAGVGVHHYKSRGQTLDVIVMYLNPLHAPALAFVAMACVRKRSDLFLAFCLCA